MSFSCVDVSKVYTTTAGPITALTSTDLTVADNEFVCLVGPSGCGKTTLLKVVAGIVEASTGRIEFHQEQPTGSLRTGLVFQDHGLFPWMDIVDNVAFGLEARGMPKGERRSAARGAVERFGLSAFAHAYPHQLSGGMRQRAGIARAMLADPQVLLMDEPFGSLDAQTKLLLQTELLQVWSESQREILYVTHDIGEAVRLADRIVVMSGHPGRILTELEVPIERPRDIMLRDHPEARELEWTIWGLLEDEVRRGFSMTP